jgi:hypothetical protein
MRKVKQMQNMFAKYSASLIATSLPASTKAIQTMELSARVLHNAARTTGEEQAAGAGPSKSPRPNVQSH